MKKGFTLVELLAVIVILAVIALITIPAVMKIIEITTINSYRRSVDLYGKTVSNAIISYESDMVEKEQKIDVTFENIDSYIEYEGNDVDCKNKTIYSDKSIILTQCYVDDELVYSEEGKGYSDEDYYYYTNSKKKMKLIKYIEAVEEAMEDKNISGTCTIGEDKITCNGEDIEIRSNLENAIEGNLTIENNKVKNYSNLKFETEKKVVKQEEIPQIVDEIVTEDPNPNNNQNNDNNNSNNNTNNDSNSNHHNNDNESQSTTFNVSVDMAEGLTPVVYDGNNWKVVDKNDPTWYDYDNQKWANAVILRNDVTKTPGQTVTVEGNNPEALIMLVWIPKYEYKIEGQYGKGGTDAAHPGEIEINFIKGTTRSATSGYYIHPAFNKAAMNGAVNGIWVGKFELSTTNFYDVQVSTLRVLPEQTSRVNMFVSDYFRLIKGITNDTETFKISNINMHMIKNSEWGAVAYLSQSKYGKYGNSDFTYDQKEIYSNPDWDTGRSTGDIPSRVNYSTERYSYDGYLINNSKKSETRNLKKGTGASTTGNIYGVYDMNGGLGEYVMGAYGTDYRPGISDSGFESNEVSYLDCDVYDYKIHNKYETELSLKNGCDENMCLGHALTETKGWYGDMSKDSARAGDTWFARGTAVYGDSAGIFSFTNADGYADHHLSSRLTGYVYRH